MIRDIFSGIFNPSAMFEIACVLKTFFRSDDTMPALMTHDFFGKELLDAHPHIIGDTDDERDAFLLGCQGPDPLFYLATTPHLARLWHIGSLMHKDFTTELMYGLSQSRVAIDTEDIGIAHAYAFGFLCHYALDSTAHPYIYALQDEICHAGVQGLSITNHNEVHAYIEREIDETMLWRCRHETVADYAPYKHILVAREHVLHVISKIFSYITLTVYGEQVHPDMYRLAVHKMRRMQHLFYSQTGMKRSVLGDIEQLFRTYSMLRSMAPRPVANPDPWLANKDHHQWCDPSTGTPHFESFFDLYREGLHKAVQDIKIFMRDPFTRDDAYQITHGINFNGAPTAEITRN